MEGHDVNGWGVALSYEDATGKRQRTSEKTVRTLVEAMGGDPEAPGPSAAAPLWVVRQGRGELLGDGASPMVVELETGERREVRGVLPKDLPLGYHRLMGGDEAPRRLAVTPARCIGPGAGRRSGPGVAAAPTVGFALQLYSLRSQGSWGMGDLADLRGLGDWSSSALGHGFVLVNPLFAPRPGLPQEASPYFPSSRRFLNPLYLRVEETAASLGAAGEVKGLSAEGRALNGAPLIDRDRIYSLKLRALELLWPRARAGTEALEAFRRERGEELERFATYCALAEAHPGPWRKWPEGLRRPDGADVCAFAEANADRIRFHMWLQLELDRQLAGAGRSLALVQDLPIGVDPDGADAWLWQDLLALRLEVGAPPDEFNTLGQAWGLPPFIPHRLRAVGYEPFIQLVRAAFRHAGGLRIDHVMGLFRLYCIPRGAAPREGAYIRYDAETLLALLALESHRANAFVVGEDLGTVEAGAREALEAHGVLSYRVLTLEKEPPRTFPAHALGAVTTHDLPTLAGLWSGSDLAEQRRLGLRPNEAGTEEIRERLARETGLPRSAPVGKLVEATHALLGEAPCQLLAVALEDALGVEARPNMPATTAEQRPNWCCPLPLDLEQVVESLEVRRAVDAVWALPPRGASETA